MTTLSRRQVLQKSLALGGVAFLAGPLSETFARAADKPAAKIRLGLCTYLWGEKWDLPTVIANCTKSQVLGVELRTQHAHGVEPSLTARERKEAKKRFADSPVTFIGSGTNEAFHYVDAALVRRAIENAKGFVKLSHDLGGSGVKVKPNDLPKGVPQKQTTEQIGRSLNELGRYAADFGQQIRLEVHGGCSPLPIIKEIMDVADHPSVAICWNSNPTDLLGDGLEHNINLVKKRLGATTHIHDLNLGKYPYQELFRLLVQADYAGWTLLECQQKIQDGIAAMTEQRRLFEGLVAKAQENT